VNRAFQDFIQHKTKSHIKFFGVNQIVF
jgi:hypothetical protein